MSTEPHKADEPVTEEMAPEEPGDVSEEEPLTIEKGKEVVAEEVGRLKDAGWEPWKEMVGNYVGRFVDGMKGMADGFAGKRKRDE